ncbi:TadE/TadG family type IV pilus assembly protein [Virgibacillus doumboii]|uniref:TadE/TadG family type IV pilus assembly protein n=1 Tax=Virgibacillus doumboii TaxID=2697503 RepID=UPI0013DF3A69|nr:TadE family protein [Virgibacillus doumboii]
MKKYIKNERGSQLLEFVGMFPMIIIAALVAWQILMVGYTMVVGEAAARDGARVASVDGNYQDAAKKSASGLYVSSSKSETGDSVEVSVTVKAPTLKIPIWDNPNIEFETSAIMPVEDEESEDDD